MPNPIGEPVERMPRDQLGQGGITGLETAIVLIAFVVVSSVFAFAALSTGLFSSDKSKETIQAGLSEVRGTLEMRGSVLAQGINTTGTGDGTDPTHIDEIIMQVSNAAGGEAVDMIPGETVMQYLDDGQSVTLVSGDFTITGLGSADSDNLVEPGELYEVKLTGLVAKLATDLAKDTLLSFQVKPPNGAVLHIERRTPVVVETFMDLG